VLNNLAWIYKEQYRLDEALALARVATTIDKNSPVYFDTLARILLELKKYKAAKQAAERAVDLEPANQDHQKTLQQVHSSAREAEQ
jgi:tetratricopeptide (TPR) repeat protein